MNSSIIWTNEKRRLCDLVPWARNPRQIKKAEGARLAESLDTFGQIHPIAIGPDDEIYDGHQRQLVWSALDCYGADFEVDVRVSSRPLTEKEREKLVVFLHRGTVAEWDWDVLANEFDVGDLKDWGFTEFDLQMHELAVEDYSDFDKELVNLEGYEEVNVILTVPALHVESVKSWLANGEAITSPGMGKGVMKRCGLL